MPLAGRTLGGGPLIRVLITMLVPSPWRADFPAIATLQRQDQIYLDSAATTQKPQALLDAINHYYANGAANVHRAQHLPGAHATQAFEDSRSKVAQWLNAGDSGQVVFTHGATSALNLLAYGLEHLFNAGDEIAISALEHHANLLPWQQLAKRRALTLVVLPLDDEGVIDLDAAARTIAHHGYAEIVRQRGVGWYPSDDTELAWAAEIIAVMRRVAARSAHASLDRALETAVRNELRRYNEAATAEAASAAWCCSARPTACRCAGWPRSGAWSGCMRWRTT